MTGSTALTDSAGGTLTDGTGISRLTRSKIVKDLVADFLLTGAATLGAAQILSIADVVQAPEAAGIALAGAAIRVLYRAVLRWATT